MHLLICATDTKRFGQLVDQLIAGGISASKISVLIGVIALRSKTANSISEEQYVSVNGLLGVPTQFILMDVGAVFIAGPLSNLLMRPADEGTSSVLSLKELEILKSAIDLFEQRLRDGQALVTAFAHSPEERESMELVVQRDSSLLYAGM